MISAPSVEMVSEMESLFMSKSSVSLNRLKKKVLGEIHKHNQLEIYLKKGDLSCKSVH